MNDISEDMYWRDFREYFVSVEGFEPNSLDDTVKRLFEYYTEGRIDGLAE